MVDLFSWLGHTPLAQCLTLVLLPYGHEDLAIALGAALVRKGHLSFVLVAVSVYVGLVSSDFALYGLGAAARRWPFARRLASHRRAAWLFNSIEGRIVHFVVLARLIPGFVFPSFVALGLAGASFTRFALMSAAIGGVYTLLVLTSLIASYDALTLAPDDLTIAFAVLVIAAFLLAKSQVRHLASVRTFLASAGVEAVASIPPGFAPAAPELGARSAERGQRVAPAERVPPALFYAPLAAHWLWLGARHGSLTLPSAANPRIVTGGMWGESKASYFAAMKAGQLAYVAQFVTIRRHPWPATAADDHAAAMARLAEAGLNFPLVAKPDVGWQGYGVRRIPDAAALASYIAVFPTGADIILQRLSPYPNEAALLYTRMPGESRGRIQSMTLRKFPEVIGDGMSDLRALIEASPRSRWKARHHSGNDPHHLGLSVEELARVPAHGEMVQLAFIGSQRVGGCYRDATHLVTAELENRLDAIAEAVPDFHYGRFDVRFDSLASLARGEGFHIVEINGIGGEAIHVWDERYSIGEVYRMLFAQQRFLFELGKSNRRRGCRSDSIVAFIAPLLRQNSLVRYYPPSE